jgi:hypothetical protein
MSIILDNIKIALEECLIDTSQALYLIYTYNKIEYPIEALKLLELSKLKYIVNNKIGKTLITEDDVVMSLSGTIKPIYNSVISAEIPKKLCRLLCEKDSKGKLRLPGTEDSIEHTAKNYLNNEGLIAYQYIIFLFMFPTYGEGNKRWERHFTGKEYEGARLRVRSGSSAVTFKRIVKTRDMGIFLYGTYLFIKSCIRENKTYVKTIRNYLREYKDWYDMAKEVIDKADSVDELFKAKVMAKEGRLNIGL